MDNQVPAGQTTTNWQITNATPSDLYVNMDSEEILCNGCKHPNSVHIIANKAINVNCGSILRCFTCEVLKSPRSIKLNELFQSNENISGYMDKKAIDDLIIEIHKIFK